MYKVRKDYKQAALVAKKIMLERTLRQERKALITGLSGDLRQKMKQSAQSAAAYIKAPDLSEEDVQHIVKAVAV